MKLKLENWPMLTPIQGEKLDVYFNVDNGEFECENWQKDCAVLRKKVLDGGNINYISQTVSEKINEFEQNGIEVDLYSNISGMLLLKVESENIQIIYDVHDDNGSVSVISKYQILVHTVYRNGDATLAFGWSHSDEINYSIANHFVNVIMIYEYLKRSNYLEVEHVNNRQTKRIGRCGYRNLLGRNIEIAQNVNKNDKTLYTTIISDSPFTVRGFWRNQACGKDHKDHKPVFINEFEKHGYHRKAKKMRDAA